MKRIIAFDPSMRGFGWVLIENNQVITAGCIKTNTEAKKRRIRKGDDTVRRINEINQQLLGVITSSNVGLILSELPHGSQNSSAAVMIGVVTGIVQTIGDCLNIPVEWYSEGDAKVSLLGKRSCTKEETIEAVSKLYDVPWEKAKFKNEAIADAMSIYHCAVKTSSLTKLVK